MSTTSLGFWATIAIAAIGNCPSMLHTTQIGFSLYWTFHEKMAKSTFLNFTNNLYRVCSVFLRAKVWKLPGRKFVTNMWRGRLAGGVREERQLYDFQEWNTPSRLAPSGVW